MADSRWISSTGDLSAAASYSPSGVPAANGSIYFDGSSEQDVVSGLTVFSAQNIARIWTQSPYYGDLGANGNPMTVQGRWIIHQGSGTFYYAHRLNSQGQTHIVVDSPNLQDAFVLTGLTSTTCFLECVQGATRVVDNAGTLAALLVGSRAGANLFVTIGSGVTVSSFQLASGIVTTKSALGVASGYAIVGGGTLIYDASGTDSWNNLNVAGGRVVYNGTGTLTSCTVDNGTLDMTQDSRAKTIGALILLPGATFLTHSNITVAVTVDLRGGFPLLP